MELQDLLLNKEELPITEHAGSQVFWMPIHPELLRRDIRINVSAIDIFEQAIIETKREIGRSTEALDTVDFDENGIVRYFFLNAHVGLYLELDERHFFPPRFVKFSEQKLATYSTLEGGKEYLTNYVPCGYSGKNISNIVHATLLRNWGILYLNAAMKEILG